MEIREKIVDFSIYCKKCKYFKLKRNDNGQEPMPCDECLDNPTNIDSRRPIHFELNEDYKEENEKKEEK